MRGGVKLMRVMVRVRVRILVRTGKRGGRMSDLRPMAREGLLLLLLLQAPVGIPTTSTASWQCFPSSAPIRSSRSGSQRPDPRCCCTATVTATVTVAAEGRCRC